MKLELKERGSRKYYGTEIEVYDDDNNSVGYFQVWLNPKREEDYKPSEREVEEHHTQSSEDDPEYNAADNPFEICDNHYESELTYRLCRRLVDAVNTGGLVLEGEW